MRTVPGFIPWLRYVVYSSSEGPECHLSHHHNYLQLNGKNAFSYAIKIRSCSSLTTITQWSVPSG